MAVSSHQLTANILSADDFAEGLLAGLAVGNHNVIIASQSELHRAFKRVLSELQQRQDLKVDLRHVDYDPLYQLSGWLDEFLARAQRDLLISFPNPSYERVEIQLTPEEGRSILNEFGYSEIFKELSELFVRELPRA